MNKLFICLGLIAICLLAGCMGRPSKKAIGHKILQEYPCGNQARIRALKVLKTEETRRSEADHIFRFTVSGQIEWPEGCSDSVIRRGAATRFSRVVTLTRTEDGSWK
jgi:hypothetical protein